MTRRRIIALVAGAAATLVTFVISMWLLIYGGYFADHELLIFVSIALGPVAVISVASGFAFWWVVMFVATLLASEPDSTPPPNR